MSKNTRNRILLTAVAALLLVAVAVGGTMAWLTDVTPAVTNTFSPSDIHISLTETWNTDSDDTDTENDSWTAQLIPGKTYAKDPQVTVNDDLTSVDAWVFVKVEDTNASDFVDYTIAQGWNQLTNKNNGTAIAGVYYRSWEDGAEVDSWYVLTGNTDYPHGFVTVKSDLTADDLYDASASLTFTAYAIQKEGFEHQFDAWTTVSNMATTADGNYDNTTNGNAHATAEDADVE